MTIQGNLETLALGAARSVAQGTSVSRIAPVRRFDESGTGVDARAAQTDLVSTVERVGLERTAGLSQAAIDATSRTLSVLEEMRALAEAASRATTPAFFRDSLAKSLAKAAEQLETIARSAEVDGTNVADGTTAALGLELDGTAESQPLVDLTQRGLGLGDLDASTEAGAAKAHEAIGAAIGALRTHAAALGGFHAAVAKAAAGPSTEAAPAMSPERARAVAVEARDALPSLGQAVLGQGRQAAQAVASLLR